MGMLGPPPPKVPPQMSELVRRGPFALPELVRHLDDRRPTNFEGGNKPSGKQIGVNAFMFMDFSDEYDPRAHIGLMMNNGNTKPSTFHVQRSATINASPEKVFPLLRWWSFPGVDYFTQVSDRWKGISVGRTR